jgi:hypothetical protein
VETHDINLLEDRLAASVRSYERVCEYGTEDQQAQDLRDVCATMARLLGQLLQTDERWNEYWWVDGVLPTLATFLSNHQLQLQGLMIWGQKGSSQEWVEPCSMAVSQTSGGLKYQILCGDALRGLGKVAYERRSKQSDQGLPEQWQFVFPAPGAPIPPRRHTRP